MAKKLNKICGTMNGLKGLTFQRGVIHDVYKKTISGGYLFDGETS